MDVLDMATHAERYLCERAMATQTPIGATFELTPLCNMDCRMCYVRLSPQELRAQGRLRTVEEWLGCAEQARDAGLLFLLLTGGEPLLYPGFRRLYEGLKDMGLVLSINTNGTLLDEETVRWLAGCPPRRLNITLYGASNETYERLCGNPHGFTQVMQALDLCQAHGLQVKINHTVTRENVEELPRVLQLVRERGLRSTIAYYVFPPNRRKADNGASRLSPAEAARARILSELSEWGMERLVQKGIALLEVEAGNARLDKPPHDTAFTCRAGTSTYWVDWQGRMLACGMTDAVRFDIGKLGFEACWERLKQAVQQTACSQSCASCRHETVCARCAAAAIAETGCFDGTPDYLCALYNSYLAQLREIVQQAVQMGTQR